MTAGVPYTEGTVLVPRGGCTVRRACDITDEEFQLPGGVSAFASAWDFAYVPRDTRPQIASGAAGRFALAGAKCERRLPARYGPAPEVPNGYGRRRVFPWRESGTDGFHPEHTEGYR
jgi:hypothetical protein